MSGPQNRVKPRVLKGFRDYPPHLAKARAELMERIRREAALAGFLPVQTPALEYAETLLGQGGEETDKQVYRFVDHGEREVALRFDLTVPFARFVAEHQGELVLPFKRLQIGDVWRGEKPQKGRYREFCQCDLDIIGVDSELADAEILNALRRILLALGAAPFTMALGHRRILSGMIAKALPGVGASGEAQTLIAIDKLQKIGLEAVTELICKIPGAEPAGVERLLHALTRRDAQGDTDLGPVRELLADDEEGLRAVDRLVDLVRLLRDLAAGQEGCRLQFDLSIARGLGYYTGVVFETTLDDLPGFGSISSGGRYDNLASRFTNRELPGVGGSIGLDRLLAGLEELGRLPKTDDPKVYVAIATEDARAYGFGLAESLRRSGIACHLGLSPKLGNQFKHADRLGCDLVITVGTDERESQSYALKLMRTGEEHKTLPASGLIDEIRQRLHQLSSAGA